MFTPFLLDIQFFIENWNRLKTTHSEGGSLLLPLPTPASRTFPSAWPHVRAVDAQAEGHTCWSHSRTVPCSTRVRVPSRRESTEKRSREPWERRRISRSRGHGAETGSGHAQLSEALCAQVTVTAQDFRLKRYP